MMTALIVSMQDKHCKLEMQHVVWCIKEMIGHCEVVTSSLDIDFQTQFCAIMLRLITLLQLFVWMLRMTCHCDMVTSLLFITVQISYSVFIP